MASSFSLLSSDFSSSRWAFSRIKSWRRSSIFSSSVIKCRKAARSNSMWYWLLAFCSRQVSISFATRPSRTDLTVPNFSTFWIFLMVILIWGGGGGPLLLLLLLDFFPLVFLCWFDVASFFFPTLRFRLGFRRCWAADPDAVGAGSAAAGADPSVIVAKPWPEQGVWSTVVRDFWLGGCFVWMRARRLLIASVCRPSKCNSWKRGALLFRGTRKDSEDVQTVTSSGTKKKGEEGNLPL